MNELHKISGTFKNTERMPLLFLGHGNPMNAIEENEFVQGFREIGKDIPKPNAVLCISAHWETRGTQVTAMETPKTIHDFGGFPEELFEVQYPATGSPELAEEVKQTVHKTEVGLDHKWGLDHGAWSVLIHLYPKADIPVLQLSLDYSQPPQYHYELAKELAALRHKGVLILGSGNMVHNLGRVDWHNPENGYEWAVTANEKFKKGIEENDFSQLINYKSMGSDVLLSVPTPEHYLPALYVLSLQQRNERATFFNDKTVMGSISMTSFKIDKD